MGLKKLMLDLLYPPKCPFCARVLEREEEGICLQCRDKLPWVTQGGRTVDLCRECLSPLWYRDLVTAGIRRYKFQGGSVHARAFGGLMAGYLAGHWAEPLDVITYVPLSARRRRERGYDQAELLARRVGELSGVPVKPMLEKTRKTQVQSRIGDEAGRRANVSGAFRMLSGAQAEGLRILLVDDVVTSGATLSECAACLRLAGAECVVALTLARAK